MNNKKDHIKTLGTVAIILSVLVGIPSIMLLRSMLIGVGKQFQSGYSMYVAMLVFLGAIPAIIGYYSWNNNIFKVP